MTGVLRAKTGDLRALLGDSIAGDEGLENRLGASSTAVDGALISALVAYFVTEDLKIRGPLMTSLGLGGTSSKGVVCRRTEAT